MYLIYHFSPQNHIVALYIYISKESARFKSKHKVFNVKLKQLK